MGVDVPPGGLTATALVTWLSGYDITPVYPGAYWPDSPDRLAVITMQPGAGLLLEGAMDAPAFQIRIRGGQNNPGDAEQIARAYDYVILTAAPLDLDGARVGVITRSGGAPAPLGGPDSAWRQEWTCTYVARVASYLPG